MKNTIILLLFPFLLQGQIYPSLTGEDLLDAVVADYKPVFVLDYSEARDVMYGEIYNLNDSVYCVYTGHALHLPTNVDPSTHLYMNASSNGINAEHTYPRSKGADEENGNAHSDMHHIYPTRTGVNSARGNSPFAEIDDNQTTNWYYKTEIENDIPAINMDSYSERVSGFFEPREDHKGNVARSMFYFYTMYKAEALEADPLFFEAQRETLCEWHYADPVDNLEIERTYQIAGYQDDLPNPFVVDCSIASRSYCDHISNPDSCEEVVSNSNISQEPEINIYPNPVVSFLNIKALGENKLLVTDVLGKELLRQKFNDELSLDFSEFSKGTYFLSVNGRVSKIIK